MSVCCGLKVCRQRKPLVELLLEIFPKGAEKSSISVGNNGRQEDINQRKFQLKMGLSTLIQIPCHHVLANEVALNLKYCIGLKQFFIYL